MRNKVSATTWLGRSIILCVLARAWLVSAQGKKKKKTILSECWSSSFFVSNSQRLIRTALFSLHTLVGIWTTSAEVNGGHIWLRSNVNGKPAFDYRYPQRQEPSKLLGASPKDFFFADDAVAESRIGTGGVISEMRDCSKGNRAILAPDPGRLTDRRVQVPTPILTCSS